MKKQVPVPAVVAVVVLLIAVAGFFMWRQTSGSGPQYIAAGGAGMAAFKKAGGDITKGMTPAEKQVMEQSMARAHGGALAGGGGPGH